MRTQSSNQVQVLNNSFPNPIIEWCNKWPSIPGAFWLEHADGKKSNLCIPLEFKGAVLEVGDIERTHLIIDKNHDYIVTEAGYRVITNPKAYSFKSMSTTQAEKLSVKKLVYYTPIQAVMPD